jgi:uncharacterized protein DUF4386
MDARRLIGVLVLVQLSGLMVPFIILMPGVTTDYLNVDAGMSGTIKTAVFLLFANAVVTFAISLAAFPLIRVYSIRATILLVAISVVWVVMQSVDNAHLLSMLSLSKRFADGGGANADLYNLLGTQVRTTRIWVHYTELLVIDAWFACFYGILLKYRFVPRLVAALGLLAVALHLIAIPLPMFIGFPSTQPLGAILAVSHVLVAGWLIFKRTPEF